MVTDKLNPAAMHEYASQIQFFQNERPDLVDVYKDMVESSTFIPSVSEEAQKEYVLSISVILETHGAESAKAFQNSLEKKGVKNKYQLFAARDLFEKKPEPDLLDQFNTSLVNELILYKMDETGCGNLLLEIARTFVVNPEAGEAFVKAYSRLKGVLTTTWNPVVHTDAIFALGAAYKESIESGDEVTENYRKDFVSYLKRSRQVPCIGRGRIPAGLVSLDEMIAEGSMTEKEFEEMDWGAPEPAVPE